jgi:hypothetical protein
MRRRHILKALVALPFVSFFFGRATSIEPELTDEEKECLVYANTAFDGCAGAIFPSDFPEHPHFDGCQGESGYTKPSYRRRMMSERLRARGLLCWTAKTPEHAGDLCGWYTITDRGRETVRSIDGAAIVRAAEERWAAFRRDLIARGIMSA